jgi:hypothetical protein
MALMDDSYFREQLRRGISVPSGRVVLSDDAGRDLESLPRITRRLLERTVRDELLAPSGSKIERIGAKGTGSSPLYALPVGNFHAVFRPILEQDPAAGEGRIVERIVPTSELSRVTELIEGAGSEPEASDPPPEAHGTTS